MENAKKSIIIVLLATAMIMFWGLNWPLVKLTLKTFTPPTLAFSRVFIAFIATACFVYFTKKLKFPSKTDWPIILTVGLNQVGLYIILITIGVSYVDANRCAILAYITPLFVMPLSYIVLGQRPTTWKILGFFIGFIGIMIMFNPLTFDFTNIDNIKGNCFIIGSAFLWAIQIVFIKAYRHDYSALSLLPWQLALSSILLFLFAYFYDAQPVSWYADINFKTTLLLLYIGVIGTAFTFWAFVQLNKMIDASTLSMITLLTPILGFTYSVLILKETMILANIIGLAFILMGILVSMGSYFKRKQRQQDV